MKSQCQRILEYFKKQDKTLTSADAWRKLGIMRLASRIHDLTKDGYSFRRERKTVINQFDEKCKVVEYQLKEKPLQGDRSRVCENIDGTLH